MQRVAMLSVHTSPLAQPGTGDGGGMNVYVRALGSALARAGVGVDVLTRAEHAEQPPVVEVEPGFRVLHVQAGPCAPVPLHELPELVGDFTDAAHRVLERAGTYDVLHANYWVSGAVGHRLKHELDLPLVATFHTLARVKAEVGWSTRCPLRPRVEAEVVRCADLVLASTHDEQDQLGAHYGADPERVEIVPPGVDHKVFSPGDRATARRRLGAPRRAARPVRRSHPTPEGRRPRGPRAGRARRAPGRARDRRRPEWSRRRSRGRIAARARRRARARAPRAVRRRRNRTTSSPTTTAPPTCASCRRAPSRSVSSRSKPPRAARRWSRPPSAGCGPSSTTASPGFSSTSAIPSEYAAIIDRVLRDDSDEMRARGGGAIDGLPLEHRRRPPASSLRRPRRARAPVKCS